MEKVTSEKELREICDQGIACIKGYINEQFESQDISVEKKAAKLAYWVKDYCRFLKKEETFDPLRRKKYERGDIVKVHFGYRIGSEHGGLHYAVVVDTRNAQKSPILCVIPLSSVKERDKIKKLHHSEVFLDDELYQKLKSKHDKSLKSAENHLIEVLGQISEIKDDKSKRDRLDEGAQVMKEIEFCDKMKKELSKMKEGSIALVSQITTISKIRIYDPIHSECVLSGIRLEKNTMDRIIGVAKRLFIG